MAVSDSKEVVIEAGPQEILDIIADVESSPSYMSAQQSVEILATHDDGRPRQVKMRVKSAGITDECVLEYTWADNVVSWSLVKIPSTTLAARQVHADRGRRQDAGALRADRRTHGAVARLRPQAGDQGVDQRRHRRSAQACAVRQKGRPLICRA